MAYTKPSTLTINIPTPKRLDPYRFVMGDFIKALQPTQNEAVVLESIMAVSYLRAHSMVPIDEELDWAERCLLYAENVQRREQIAQNITAQVA
jgi:hypothetical protein